MLETLLEGNDWLTYLEQPERGEKADNVTLARATPVGESHFDSWNKTDRPLHFPARPRPSEPFWDDTISRMADQKSARARWLQKHDVHTEFIDAGIGCCWFAQQGDDEPVCGQTEEAAIEKLARENGIEFSQNTRITRTNQWGQGARAHKRLRKH